MSQKCKVSGLLLGFLITTQPSPVPHSLPKATKHSLMNAAISVRLLQNTGNTSYLAHNVINFLTTAAPCIWE